MPDNLIEQNPFETLGVRPEDTDDVIRRRYLELVRLHPPERDPEKFKAIRAAYDAVKDEDPRLSIAVGTLPAGALHPGPFAYLPNGVTPLRAAVALLSAVDPLSDLGRVDLDIDELAP